MAQQDAQRYEPWLTVDLETETGVLPLDAAEAAGAPVLSYALAVRQAMQLAMEHDERVFVMGQGADSPDGLFGCTRDLHKQFGAERCFDTPLAETALMGVAAGAAMAGRRPVYFHNRPDFLYLSLDQLANHAAKWNYLFAGQVNVPLVVWACIGRGWGSGAQHSQAPHGLFMHVPGLKVVMPATAHDAKGLLLAAIADPDPVLIIEHRFNLRTKGGVPEGMYRTPLGKAVVRRTGTDVSLIAASWMVHEAWRAAQELQEQHGISAEVVDLRTVKPMDEETVCASVRKTGRLVVCDLGWRTAGLAAEVMAVAAENCVPGLKAPARRVTPPDVPTPSGYTLEAAFYPGMAQIVAAARELCRQK